MTPFHIALLIGVAAVGAFAVKKTMDGNAAIPSGDANNLTWGGFAPALSVNPALLGSIPFAVTPPAVSAQNQSLSEDAAAINLSGFIERAIDRMRNITSRVMVDNSTMMLFNAGENNGGLMSWGGTGGAGTNFNLLVQSAIQPGSNPLILSDPVDLTAVMSPPFVRFPNESAGDFIDVFGPVLTGDAGGNPQGPSNPNASSPSPANAPGVPSPSTDLFNDPTIQDMMGTTQPTTPSLPQAPWGYTTAIANTTGLSFNEQSAPNSQSATSDPAGFGGPGSNTGSATSDPAGFGGGEGQGGQGTGAGDPSGGTGDAP
jgi:hypothetical protein